MFATIVVVSGITATVFQWHDDSEVQREVFGNIPSEWKLLFYTVLPVLILYGSVLFSQRVRNWERGGPDRRATTKKNAGRRLKDFRAGVYMQTLLRDPAAGVMHSLIYFSFLILLRGHDRARDQPPAAGVGQVPARRRLQGLLGHRRRRRPDAADRRGVGDRPPLRAAPYRIRIKTKPEHAIILGTFLALGRHRLRGRGVAHRPARAAPPSRSGRSSATRSPG